jgi:Holliday junction resolvasome RuvABC endonuclease subunit
MSNKLYKILAINPGSRYIGVAVFYGNALQDWQIKNVLGRPEKQKLLKVKNIVLQLIERHEPDIIVLKKLHPSRASIHLKRIANLIEKLAYQKKIRIRSYSIKQVKDLILRDKPRNKARLAEVLANKYPDLLHEFKKEIYSKNHYHIRMFEAVALGAICCDQLK